MHLIFLSEVKSEKVGVTGKRLVCEEMGDFNE